MDRTDCAHTVESMRVEEQGLGASCTAQAKKARSLCQGDELETGLQIPEGAGLAPGAPESPA